ncbi:MAG: Ig-like domain-containing protein, partial [Desulfotomaculaceae bacterium]|nr:Ig-like domain-containing protein [Desulfotomaculaceae bacterium]
MKKLKLCLLMLTVVLLSVSFLGTASASEDMNEPVGVDSVSLDKTELTLTVGGSPETLTAMVLPENATNKEVEWSSGDPGVATVEEGVVTPVAAGSTVVTVKTVDGAKTATCSVTVQEIVEEDENGEDGQLDQRWKEWKEIVPADKVWKVTFNIPILPESVNDKSVYVHSNKSKKVNIRIEFSDDNKTIIINPPEE